MKFNSKSIEKFANYESTGKEEQINFKKSTYFTSGSEEKIYSGHTSNKNYFKVTNDYNK